MQRRSLLTGSAAVLAAAARARAAETGETVLGAGSFANYAALEANWNYRYPWGSDHNGSARMYGSPTDHNHVTLSGGVLTLKASRITWDEGTSGSPPHLPIRYHSGTIHAKDQVRITSQFPNYEVKGEFQAPSAPGSWHTYRAWITRVGATDVDIHHYLDDT
ncbi:hypothetical protein [Streptomyces radicis]|uniref:hypothetical protein n=1 Tax=Streptomyces radicis TaxID=1750517 RepID=UPI001E33514D|nr:hypothetical protein [Streptomyces radicis]